MGVTPKSLPKETIPAHNNRHRRHGEKEFRYANPPSMQLCPQGATACTCYLFKPQYRKAVVNRDHKSAVS